MKASEMKQGDMFLLVPKGIHQCYLSPEVFVKTHDGTVTVQGVDASRFVKNSALVRMCLENTPVSFSDYWAVTDRYFNALSDDGQVRIISDLRELEGICEELGIPVPEMELP